ncbi:MAG: DUF3137 domain-containing protein [Bacteroidota bacterium]
MKSSEEIRELYDTQLKPVLESLEGQRVVLKRRMILIIVVFVSVFILFFIADSDPDLNFLFFLIPVGLILFGFLIYKMIKPYKAYKDEFKEKVVREIINLINPDWNYDPEGFISREEYHASKLFTKGVARYKGDDLVDGIIDKTDFRLSELHSEYKTESTDSKGRKRTSYHTIFKGLFGHAEFNKEIAGETLVLPDTAERMLGSLGTKLQKMSGRGKLIKMENVEFEKLFVVYGSDQIESRYVLTPTMMEAMMSIVEKYNKYVYFSFIGSRVYFAISFTKDLFEPRLFGSGIRFNDVEEMNEQFRIIQTIINELNLNTRIWTKE